MKHLWSCNWLHAWAVVFALFLMMSGCEAGKSVETINPTQEQVIEAFEELIDSHQEGGLPDAIGPAIEKILSKKSQSSVGGDYPVSKEPGSLAFVCGPRSCACAEGENIPDHLRDKWRCEGMGEECKDKGYIPRFPCTITSTGMSVCLCVHPDGIFK
jgi:hypothetical protein